VWLYTNWLQSSVVTESNGIVRRLSPIQTSDRRISSSRRNVSRVRNSLPEEPIAGRLEMDSHADTCVFGENFIILDYSGRECDVSPFTDDYDSMKDVPIVTGATAWKSRHGGDIYPGDS
jgi:hypothetical protein